MAHEDLSSEEQKAYAALAAAYMATQNWDSAQECLVSLAYLSPLATASKTLLGTTTDVLIVRMQEEIIADPDEGGAYLGEAFENIGKIAANRGELDTAMTHLTHALKLYTAALAEGRGNRLATDKVRRMQAARALGL